MNNHPPNAGEVQSTAGALPPSLIRTLLPFLAGLAGTWLVERFGVDVDTATIGALLTAGIGYGYYAAARFLEVFASDKWGYILGTRKTPLYATPPLPTTVVAVEDVDGRHERGFVELATAGVAVTIVGVVGLVYGLLEGGDRLVTLFAVVLVVGMAVALLGARTRR